MADWIGVDVDDATPEEWRPIPGWGDLYEASSLGRIRRIRTRNGRGYYDKVIVMKPQLGKQGYYMLRLWRDGKPETKLVHRLIAGAFLGKRPDDLEIRHLNDNKLDNRLVNLVYGTHRENMLDIVRNENHDQANKTHCPYGHEYTPDNIYRSPKSPNKRWCRKCLTRRTTEYRRRRRAAQRAAKEGTVNAA